MAAEIWNALTGETHLVAEAGTGVGKSFAYLVPSVFFSVDTGTPVVISTKTLNLQDQLIHKDIPVLHTCFDVEFRAEVLKGRSNYLCRRRLKYASEHTGGMFESGAHRNACAEIIEWAGQTSSGIRDEMPFIPDLSVWSRVCCESSACTGRKCSERSRCFYQKARNRLNNADVIVVNHSLYFSDCAVRASAGGEAGVLPLHGHVIFDEARSIEEIAADHVGARLSNFQVAYLLRDLYNPGTGKGLLQIYGTGDARGLCENSLHAAERYFSAVEEWARRGAGTNDTLRELEREQTVENGLSGVLMDLAGALRECIRLADEDDTVNEDIASELNLGHDRVIECASILSFFSEKEEDSSYARWAEFGGGASGRIVSLNRVPLDVSEFFAEHLFACRKSVIMTGATLSISQDNDFDYFSSKIGLKKYRGVKLDSPFDFQKNAVLHLARTIPGPKSPDYREAALDKLREFIISFSGGGLILFTSYSMMNDFADILHDSIVKSGRNLFVQGSEKSRTAVLQEFKDAENGILFATSSFWTGVDVRGGALRNVVIMRLPFAVPNHPIIKGKCRLIAERGENPFTEFIVPEAVLTFKQGIGRLLRSRSDSGNIFVFDSRIVHARYGRYFQQAVPQCPVEYF